MDSQEEQFGEIEESLLFSTFYGNSADYYLKCLNKIKTGKKLVFNIYAFVFAPFWLAYRKMYAEVAVILVIYLLLVILLGMPPWGAYIVLSINLGLVANYLYVRKSLKEIDKAKADYQNLGDRVDYLQDVGGTSYSAVLFLIGLLVLAILSIAIFGIYLLGYRII